LSSTLRDAAEGLLYTSEGDCPFDELSIPGLGSAWPQTKDQFLLNIGATSDVEVREQTLDQFFARHIEKSDPQDARLQAMRPRFEALRATLREELREVRVFRVGTVEVRCYIVGADASGNLSGLVTTSLES
jgi:Nuclease A inhibitor-like protein